MLIVLAVILFLLIMIFCGDQGAKAVISLVIDAFFILAAVFLIYKGLPPAAVTAAACLLITLITLFYLGDVNVKTKSAFVSVAIVVLVLIPLIWFFASGAHIGGFNSEQYEIKDTEGYTRNIAVDMISLQISVMFIALIGTVADTAVAITSSIYEIRQNNQTLPFGQLLKSAFNVSKAVLNTSIHTIFYIYIAEYMTLMMQYINDFTFSQLINSKSFCQEFLTVSMSGIGCCLIVPVATIIGSLMITDRRGHVRQADVESQHEQSL